MTRWARNQSAQKHGKLPADSTPWSELKTPTRSSVEKPSRSNMEKPSSSNDKSNKKAELALKPKLTKKLKPTKKNSKPKRKRVNSLMVVSDSKPAADSKPPADSPSFEILNSPTATINPKPKKTINKNKERSAKKVKQPIEVKVLTEEEKIEKIKKNEKYREKLINKRNKSGILLLPDNIERKIYRMKSGMRRKGISGVEIRDEIRKYRRKQEMLLRKDDSVCHRCREPGHKVADCKMITEDQDQSMGICFKCGSTEHKLQNCTASVNKKLGLPFAKCFVCNKKGHLSSSCSKNPKGKYPHGGSCKVCGSVNHFAKDCPREQENMDDEPTLGTLVPGVSVDFDGEIDENKIDLKKSKKKPINF